METFPGDGTTWFGTLRGNRGWRVEGGALDEIRPQPRRIASYDDVRLVVADNSESADVTTELVDVGRGADRRDYVGKDVRGRLVLCDAAPSACHRLAVEELGAAGLISYNSNQVSAWWRDDADLIRWGHLDARGRRNTFALMISLREARALQQRLARGERITLHAVVQARNDDSMPYETAIATIPGTDPGAGDIVFSCHLDHEKPGANDNASGCSANLEIARALKTLIDARRIPPPVRTIRFIWPSEMTGTIAYLTKYPDIAGRIKAVVHLDMVGGDPSITKSVLHVTRSPWSIATVTDDVQEIFGRYVIDGAMRGRAMATCRGRFGRRAAPRTPSSPTSPRTRAAATIGSTRTGRSRSRRSTCAITRISTFTPPAIVPDNIEPTKIKRSAFIAAASGYYLARFPKDAAALLPLVYSNALGSTRRGRPSRCVARMSVEPREAAIVVGQGGAARAAAAWRRSPASSREDPARSVDSRARSATPGRGCSWRSCPERKRSASLRPGFACRRRTHASRCGTARSRVRCRRAATGSSTRLGATQRRLPSPNSRTPTT